MSDLRTLQDPWEAKLEQIQRLGADARTKKAATVSALDAMAKEKGRQGDTPGWSLTRNFAAGFTESSNQAAAAVFGGIPRMIGDVTDSYAFKTVGKTVEDFFEANMEFAPKPTREAMGTGSWADVNPFHNPAGFAYGLGSLTSTIGQMVTPGAALKVLNGYRAAIPSLISQSRKVAGGIELSADVAEKALRWGRAMTKVGASADEVASVAREIGIPPSVFATALAKSRPIFQDAAELTKAGNAIGATLAGHIQGYQTYKQVKEAGANDIQALAAYGVMAMAEGKLDAHLLSRWFGEFPPTLKGRLINAAATAGVESTIPFLDLATQWGVDELGQEFGADPLNKQALLTMDSVVRQVQQGMSPAALLGFLMGTGYSKRDRTKQDLPPEIDPDAIGEPAHGALGFTGRKDALFYFYGTDKPIPGSRVVDQRDGTFQVKGTDGSPDVIVPYGQVESVSQKNNALNQEGSLLWQDQGDTNPIAIKYKADKILQDFGLGVEKLAAKEKAAREKRMRKQEIRSLQGQDLLLRVQEIKAAGEDGGKRDQAITALSQNLGAEANSFLNKALQPGSNRKAHASLSARLLEAETTYEALKGRPGLNHTFEGKIAFEEARSRVQVLQAKVDLLDLFYEDMLDALGEAGDAAARFGGKKVAKQVGSALTTEPEKVAKARGKLEKVVSEFQAALSDPRAVPPGTDIRMDAETGLQEAEATLSLFDKYAPVAAEGDTLDMLPTTEDLAKPSPVQAPASPQAASPGQVAAVTADPRVSQLSDLRYTPEEIKTLIDSGRAQDIIDAQQFRPTIYGAGVKETIEALRLAGVDEQVLRDQSLLGVRGNAAKVALELVPQVEREPVPSIRSARDIAFTIAESDHKSLVQSIAYMKRIIERVKPERLSQADTQTTQEILELRALMEREQEALAVLERQYPQFIPAPKVVNVGVPGVGIISDNPTLTRPTPAKPAQPVKYRGDAYRSSDDGIIEFRKTYRRVKIRRPVKGQGGITMEDILMGRPEPKNFFGKNGSVSWDQVLQDAVDRGFLPPEAGPSDLYDVLVGARREDADSTRAKQMEEFYLSKASPEAQALVREKGTIAKALRHLTKELGALEKQGASTEQVERLLAELDPEVPDTPAVDLAPGVLDAATRFVSSASLPTGDSPLAFFPEPFTQALREALLAAQGDPTPLSADADMFLQFLETAKSEKAVTEGLGKLALSLKEYTALDGTPFQSFTVEDLRKALNVPVPEDIDELFGLRDTEGNLRLFQTGSPAQQINAAVERFHAAAGVGALKRANGWVKQLIRGTLSPMEVAVKLLESRGRVSVDGTSVEEGGVSVLSIQLTAEKQSERFATVQALGQLAQAIQDGLAAAVGNTYSPTILTNSDLALMGHAEWLNRYEEAMRPGSWLHDLRASLRQAQKETGAYWRSEEEDSYLRLFHGVVEHAAALQGIPAETAARKWLESRRGSGQRLYGKEGFLGIVGSPSGDPAQAMRRGDPTLETEDDVVKGWYTVMDGPDGVRGMITITEHADFTTLVEELAHFTRTTLTGDSYARIRAAINAQLKKQGLPGIEAPEGVDVWSRDAEEMFAKWMLATLRDTPLKEIPGGLKPLLDTVKPVLSSLWDKTLDVYGKPSPEVRASMIRLFNPLLPKANATGKMVGVRVREQASRYGVNTFTATMFTPEQLQLAAMLAEGTSGTQAVAEANATSEKVVFSEVAEWMKDPQAAVQRIQEIMQLGGTPGPALQLFSALTASSDAIPAMRALMEAKTERQRMAAWEQLQELPATLLHKQVGMSAGQTLWARKLDPTSKLLNLENGTLQLMKQMSASDAKILFQTIAEAASGDPDAVERLAKIQAVTAVETPQFSDYLSQLAYSGMLLSPRLMVTNGIMAGVLASALKYPLKASAVLVDMGWSYVAQKPREMFFAELSSNMHAFRTGWKRGVRGAKDILATGRTDDPLDSARKFSDADRYTQKHLAFEHAPDVIDVPFIGKKAWGAKLRAAAPYIALGSNLNHAMDFMARSLIYHDQLWAISLRRALAEGAENPDFTARAYMKRAMDGTQDTGFMRKEAELLSFQATGADEPGTFTKHLITAKNSFGIAAIPFMPFVNTLANLMKRSAEIVPGVGYAVWRSQVKEQLGKDTPTFYVDKPQEMIGKQIAGGVLAMILASMFQERDEEGMPVVTGSLPKSASERDFWRRNRIIPYSVRVGKQYVQFSRLEPFGMVLMGAANAADSWAHYQRGQSDPREAENATAYAVTETFFNNMWQDVLGNSYASNFFRIADKEGSNLEEMARSTTSLVPFSGLLRTLTASAWQAANEGEYVSQDVGPAMGALLGIVPGLAQALGAEPRRSAFGEPIVYDAQSMFRNWLPIQVSEGLDLDPVEEELRRVGYYPTVPLPTKQIALTPNGLKYNIPADLWTQHVMEAGIEGKKALARVVSNPGYQRLADGSMEGTLRQARMLENALQAVRGRYSKWLKGEMQKRLQAGLLERPVALSEREDPT